MEAEGSLLILPYKTNSNGLLINIVNYCLLLDETYNCKTNKILDRILSFKFPAYTELLHKENFSFVTIFLN